MGEAGADTFRYTRLSCLKFFRGIVKLAKETLPKKHRTIRQIKIFESVARHLSFSRAAEDLHLTQPAVSMQIKQMEGLAGLPLFEHSGKRIALTEGGNLVLRHCQVILADLNAAEQSLANLMTGSVQHLRVFTAFEKMLRPLWLTVLSSTLPLALMAAVTAGELTEPPEPYSAPEPTMRSRILIWYTSSVIETLLAGFSTRPSDRLVECSGFRPSTPTSRAPAELGASCTKAVVGPTLVAD
jgi:hypothetical protein